MLIIIAYKSPMLEIGWDKVVMCRLYFFYLIKNMCTQNSIASHENNCFVPTRDTLLQLQYRTYITFL